MHNPCIILPINRQAVLINPIYKITAVNDNMINNIIEFFLPIEFAILAAKWLLIPENITGIEFAKLIYNFASLSFQLKITGICLIIVFKIPKQYANKNAGNSPCINIIINLNILNLLLCADY